MTGLVGGLATRARRVRWTSPYLWLGILYLVGTVIFLAPVPRADGLVYFGETRSILLDGDVDLATELRYEPSSFDLGTTTFREAAPRDLDGSFVTYVNVGVVLLFAPFFLLAHALGALGNLLGFQISMDGYDQPYVLFVSLAAPACILASGCVLVRALRPRVGAAWAAISFLAVWLGSSLFRWTFFRPTHTHAPSVIAETLFVVLFLTRGRDPRDLRTYAVLGLLGGFLLTLRPITGVYSAVPALFLAAMTLKLAWEAYRAAPGGRSPRLRTAARAGTGPVIAGLVFLAASLVGRLPQFVFARDFGLFGSSFYSETGYVDRFSGQVFEGVASLAFDPLQGVAWWSPIVIVGLVGLAGFWRRDRFLLWSVAFVALLWLAIGSLPVPQRFGGIGLDSRHLVEGTPLYVLGIAGAGLAAQGFLRRWAPSVRQRWRRLLGLAFGLVVAWGFFSHLAAHVGAGGQLAGPAGRVLSLMMEPALLSRIFERGSFITAFALEFVQTGQLVSLAFFFLFFGFAVLVGGVVVYLVRRGRRFGARVGGAPAIAWVPVLLLMVGTVAPAFSPADTAVRGTGVSGGEWIAGRGSELPDGRVTGLRVGLSETGNAIVDAPPAREPGRASASSGPVKEWAPLPATGVAWTIDLAPPAAGMSHLELWLRGVEGGTGDVLVRVRGAEQATLSVVTTQVVVEDGVSPTLIRLPVPLADRESRLVVQVAPAVEGLAVEIGLDAEGVPAYRAYTVDEEPVPLVALVGETLAGGSGPRALPQPAVIGYLPDGSATLRLGPWGANDMLMWADGAENIAFPGPTDVPRTWDDSVGRALVAPDATLYYRLRAPERLLHGTVRVLASAYLREAEGAVSVETMGESDSAWQPAGTETFRGRYQRMEFPVNFRGASEVLIAVRLTGTGSIGLNLMTIDASFDPQTWSGVASSPTDALTMTPGPLPVSVRVDRVLAPPGLAAYQAGRLLDGLLGDWVRALAVAAIAAAVALILAFAARTRRWVLPVLSIALVFLVGGLLRLPRTLVLPETQSFAGGYGLGVAARRDTVSEAGYGTGLYVSPPIPISPGARSVDEATARTSVGAIPGSVRFSTADGWTAGSDQFPLVVPPDTRFMSVVLDLSGTADTTTVMRHLIIRYTPAP